MAEQGTAPERTAPRAPAVGLAGVTISFRVGDGATFTAVEHASLDVADGEFVAIVGPTGCGKSTLLNVAVGLLQPSAGAVRVFGEPLSGLNRKAGYLFQTEALMPWRTALGNVTAGLEFRKIEKEEAKKRGAAWCRGSRYSACRPATRT